jgi:hypothetical protein
MGANAVTTTYDFVANQILTAAQMDNVNCGIPVFASTTTRDAAFGGAGEKTLAQGQFCYLESTGKLQVYTGSAWANVGTQTNVARFTASGTWTVPTGVSYATAYIIGGGGGLSLRDRGTPTVAAGAGGTSSVAFAGGTVSAIGGAANTSNVQASGGAIGTMVDGLANTGQGALCNNIYGDTTTGGTGNLFAQSSAYIVAGGAVTAGASITITVGAGGTAGSGASTVGSAGGTGYVYITYEV